MPQFTKGTAGSSQGGSSFLRDFQSGQAIATQIREAKQKADEDAVEREAFQLYTTPDKGTDFDSVINHMSAKAPKRALALRTLVDNQRTNEVNRRKAELETNQKKLEVGARAAQGIYDQASLDARMPVIRALSPEVADSIGPVYSKERIDSVIRIGMTAQQVIQDQITAVNDFLAGKKDIAYWKYLSTAQTPEQVEKIKSEFRGAGLPEAVIKMTPEWTDAKTFQAATRDLGMTPAERATMQDRIDDNKRQDDAALATAKYRQQQLDDLKAYRDRQNNIRERALGNGPGGTRGLTPATLEATRRAAEAQLNREMTALETRREKSEGAMSDVDYQAEVERIQSNYRRMLNAPDNQALPEGVQTYVRGLTKKYKIAEAVKKDGVTTPAVDANAAIAKAADEIDRAWPKIQKDHPGVDRAQVDALLTRLYGAEIPAKVAPPPSGALPAPAAVAPPQSQPATLPKVGYGTQAVTSVPNPGAPGPAATRPGAQPPPPGTPTPVIPANVPPGAPTKGTFVQNPPAPAAPPAAPPRPKVVAPTAPPGGWTVTALRQHIDTTADPSSPNYTKDGKVLAQQIIAIVQDLLRSKGYAASEQKVDEFLKKNAAALGLTFTTDAKK